VPSLAEPTVPGSLSSRFRAGRWQQFTLRFPDISDMTVIDLGGNVETWTAAPVQPKQVVTLNLSGAQTASPVDWIEVRTGDACDPDAVVGEFDLVFSNSVMEHVGGHERRERFAETVSRLAPHHWIQTPNRWFPVEPHWVCPGFQFLPRSAQVWLSRYWPLGHFRCGSSTPYHVVLRDIMAIDLMTARELAYYFPESTILKERVAGLAKSIIAVR
jgi:hypothetical protein